MAERPPRRIIDAPPGPPLDLRHTATSMGGALAGYGLTRGSARERAAVVRAVTDDTRIQQRPMPVVIVTALVSIFGLVVWAWQLWLTITDEQPLSLVFWVGLVTFLAASAICSWAWQLYDVRKAIVMWLAIAALGVAAVLVLLVVLVALKGDGDLDLDVDLDGLVERITGSAAARDPVGFADHVVLPLADQALGAMAIAGEGTLGEGTVADEGRWSGIAACPTCDVPLDGALRCPRCGWTV
jgi:hypothetical protein